MKQKHLETLWFCSFRYCLGRSSYIVSDFEEAFSEHFEEIPEKTKKLILRELQYAFKLDNRQRIEDPDKYQYELGQSCDKLSWQSVLIKLTEWEQSCQ